MTARDPQPDTRQAPHDAAHWARNVVTLEAPHGYAAPNFEGRRTVGHLRRSRGSELRQRKWFHYAATPIVIIPMGFYGPGPLGGLAGVLAFGWVVIGLPVAIGIAVVRYRLYDMDVIINRTLVYGALSASLALVYVGGVVLLQGAFRAFIGGESQLAIVASTLTIAALFGPLRRRIQSLIDKRFYRRKYDATRTLEAFSAKLRDETDLDALSGDLLGVVHETLQPTHVSFWLRPAKKE